MTDSQSRIFDSCNLAADYSQAGSEPVLPFLITLNLTASRLEPAAGERQRFCYDVTGVGEAGAAYADLSQLILGICDEITAEEIAGIAVTVDGEEQEVDFSPEGNVVLRSADDPDTESGCSGLAFYFPLSREDSQMQLCFELTVPRPIGPVAVCLSGGGLTLNDLDICGPVCAAPEQPLVAYYRADVCAPVSITPYVVTGTPEFTVCGEPEIGLDGCGDTEADCGFSVRLQLCVAVPLTFGVLAEAGAVRTDCLAAGGAEICDGCGEEEPPQEQGVISRPGYCG